MVSHSFLVFLACLSAVTTERARLGVSFREWTLKLGRSSSSVAGFSLNLFCRNEFISLPAEHIVREIDGTRPRNSSSILRGDRHCRVCNCACARPAGKERDKIRPF